MWHTRRGTASPRGSSTTRYPTYGRPGVQLVPSCQRSLLTHSNTWSHESLQDCILFFRSLYSAPGQFANPGNAIAPFPVGANSKSAGPRVDHYLLLSSKPNSHLGTQRVFIPYLYCVSPSRFTRLIYARFKPLIDPLLLKEQAGFRYEWSTVIQVNLLK